VDDADPISAAAAGTASFVATATLTALVMA
jgi:hypothetical protein